MRKVTKPAVLCHSCKQTIEYEQSEEFCDVCEEKIETGKMLNMTIFYTSEITKEVNFDSWACVRKYLMENKQELLGVHFISLPYPTGEERGTTNQMPSFFKDFLLNDNKATIEGKTQ